MRYDSAFVMAAGVGLGTSSSPFRTLLSRPRETTHKPDATIALSETDEQNLHHGSGQSSGTTWRLSAISTPAPGVIARKSTKRVAASCLPCRPDGGLDPSWNSSESSTDRVEDAARQTARILFEEGQTWKRAGSMGFAAPSFYPGKNLARGLKRRDHDN